MATNSVIGYGVFGRGESKRYAQRTFDSFKKMGCRDVILLCNNVTDEDIKFIEKHGYKYVHDNREWGKNQWKMKQDFIENHVAKLDPDWLVCLDMDEEFDGVSRETLEEWGRYGDALYFFIVNLWDDGWLPQKSFWNIRAWRWNGFTEWEQKPVHCGLAPQWTYQFGVYTPHLLLHHGLKKKEDREKKVARYQKYDSGNKYLGGDYYQTLASEIDVPKLDLEQIRKEAGEAITKPQFKKEVIMNQDKEFYYIRHIKTGKKMDIPARQLEETLARGEHELISEQPITRKAGGEKAPIKTVEEKDVSLECEVCGFQAKSAFGLRSHHRKH